MHEYRVCCSANMVGAEWEGDWFDWPDDNDSPEEIRRKTNEQTFDGAPARNAISRGLEKALEMSGFDYWVDVRPKENS